MREEECERADRLKEEDWERAQSGDWGERGSGVAAACGDTASLLAPRGLYKGLCRPPLSLAPRAPSAPVGTPSFPPLWGLYKGPLPLAPPGPSALGETASFLALTPKGLYMGSLSVARTQGCSCGVP